VTAALPGILIAGTVPPIEFVWMVPLCAVIALVSSAAHREDLREILRHAARSTVMLIGGLLAFMVAISYLFEWLLP
jgi:NhaP-type Na+/H+ or K+/H+ antiporter